MGKKLLIVESPAKAKTIEKYLGGDFEVVSSYGHIRDLEKEGMGIDIQNNFQPKYIVSTEKKKVVADLKSKAKKAEEVWLATDEDREGEAISWHLCEVLGLDPKTTKRIVFHEITKNAIKKAIEQPRHVDLNLVDAQQARRVVDRLVGFEVSPILWRKLSGTKALSAGRVQSVAVKLLVERENEINQFIPVSHYKIEGHFTAAINNKTYSFKASGKNLDKESDANSFLEKCINATYKVGEITVKPAKQSPSAPFTTSTLQQEASRKLGFNVSRTMRVAQDLYENGYISYMRTDSVNLSETAIDNIKENIIQLHGETFFQKRVFKNKNASAQEAHEAIRPTDMSVTNVGNPDAQKLYNLIWKRTMASQMADAILEKTNAQILIHNHENVLEEQLIAQGEVIKFEGFLKVYMEGKDDDHGDEENNSLLPPLQEGMSVDLIELNATERFSRPAPRYTEASLVKKLEELGIGRPSTYAPTISTIQQRGYVERKEKEGKERKYSKYILKNNTIQKTELTEITGQEKGKLMPTDLGIVVTQFLNEHFSKIMDYGFTAKIENQFDDISNGNVSWTKVISDFYTPFHERVEETMENAERVSGDRELGIDPNSGRPIIARLGKFGPMVQIGHSDDEEKPLFASLRPHQSISTITLEEALDLFKLPYDLGEYENQMMTIGVGRFGPYIKWNDTFISIPKTEDPLTITKERAIELIEEKRRADAPIFIYQGEAVTKGKGRFGPFLKWKDLYVNVPARYNFDELTDEQIVELISAKVEKEKNRYIALWEDEKIAIENGRWGPFIRFGKQMLKLGKKADGTKYDADDLKDISLEEVKKMIVEQLPDAFEKKTKKTATKKAATKKTSTKKSATKKAVVKKSNTKK